MTYAPDERRPPEERHAQVALDDARLVEIGETWEIWSTPTPGVPAPRDHFIWRDPALTEEALTMERDAWEKADAERRVLAVRVTNLRQALFDCAVAAGMDALDRNVGDVLLLIEVPETVRGQMKAKERRIAELESENRMVDAAHGIMAARMHTAEAEAAAAQDLAERSLKMVERLATALAEATVRIEQCERERRTPLTYKEFARAADAVLGWKGEWLRANLALGAELIRRGIDPGHGAGGATTTALAEIDRLRSVHGAIYGTWDEAFRAGHSAALNSPSGHLTTDEEVYRAYAESRTFRREAVNYIAANLPGAIDATLAQRKLEQQP